MKEHFDNIIHTSLVGSRFVYKSKYGSETMGVVADTRVIREVLTHPKNKHGVEIPSPKEIQGKVGIKIHVKIISTNGIVYSLLDDDIYFLDLPK